MSLTRILYGVPLAGLLLYLGAMILVLAWLLKVHIVARRKRREPPGITIFKPLAGHDDGLAANLESFARLDYPTLQIIFAAAHEHDLALAVARSLAERYPQLDILILADGSGTAINPKIRLLEVMLPHAKHPWCLISDSNVRVEPDDLLRLTVSCHNPRIGLVYQPVVGIGEETAAAAVENMRLTEYAGLLSIAAKVLTRCQDVVMGKGMLLRREALDSMGGFASMHDVLAEDYLIGCAIKRAGWKITPGHVPVRAVHTHWSWKNVISRHLRHGSMRARLEPWAYPLELFLNPTATALPALFFGGWWGLAFFAGVCVATTVIEVRSERLLRGRPMAWKYVPLVPVKNLLMFGLWVVSIFQNKVHWRGRTYRIGYGTRLELISVDAPAPVSVAEQPAETVEV